MFSLVTRAQTLGNTALTALSVISVLVALISVAQLYFGGAWDIDSSQISRVKAVALLRNSRMYGLEGKPKENSKIAFDLAADLRPLFNWNTKQVFVYLTAEYDGKTPGLLLKVVYWDRIIRSKERAVLDLHNVKAKYSVWDVEPSFRGRNATLRLEWNVQPWVGPLLFGSTETASTFQFALLKELSP